MDAEERVPVAEQPARAVGAQHHRSSSKSSTNPGSALREQLLHAYSAGTYRLRVSATQAGRLSPSISIVIFSVDR